MVGKYGRFAAQLLAAFGKFKHSMKVRTLLGAALAALVMMHTVEAQAAKRKKSKTHSAKSLANANANADAGRSKKSLQTTKTVPSAIHDDELMAVYSALAEGKLNQALNAADALVLKAPNFSVGHLLRADILNIKALRPMPVITAQAQANFLGSGEAARRMTELRAESQLRLLALQHPPQAGEIPSHLISIAPSVPLVLVADGLRSRLYVYENSAAGLKLVRSVYITQGRLGANKWVEGDQKTPMGVYFSDGAIDKKLPDLYGFGALNTDYPNVWDKKLNRTGHGIWLHGTPKESYARAPYASDGCVVMANPDIAALFPIMNAKVPVVLAENLRFVAASQLEAPRAAMHARLNAWLSSVSAGQAAQMADFYAKDFTADVNLTEETKGGQTVLAAWLARKTALAATMGGLTPKISGLTVIAYPNENDLVQMRFELHYPAQAVSTAVKPPRASQRKAVAPPADAGMVLRKTLYWKKIDGQWLITLESAGV